MSESAQQASVTATEQMGVLTRELQVRILNCSSSGCLVETNARLDVGTVGTLRLTIDGGEYVDELMVVRCQAIEGAGSIFHVGAKFLWTGAPTNGTLRRAMSHDVVGAVATVTGKSLM